MAGAIAGMQVAGGALSAVGAMNQAKAAESAGYYNATVNERNAALASQQATADVSAQRRVASRAQGAAVAGYGASGVTMEGSPLDVLAMSASHAKLDEETLRYQARLKGMGFESAAALDRMRAKTAKKQGPLMAASYLLGAGGQAGATYATISRPYSSTSTTATTALADEGVD